MLHEQPIIALAPEVVFSRVRPWLDGNGRRRRRESGMKNSSGGKYGGFY
jgi:hypothetical protein